ncbi:MAG: helix-turn-helix domain-containing protein [Rhodopila sp.]|nr:helix-turn-helix domain-containing protein [Rhodopila sp.]
MCANRIVESSDPDEFISLIRPRGCELLVTERGQFKARSILIDIGRLFAQRRCEHLARIVHVDMPRPGIIFLTAPGPSMFWDGAEIGQEDLALFGSGQEYVSRLSGPTSWGAISLADDDMEAICTSYFGCSSSWISGCTVITPPPGALARLRSLHAAAGHLVETSPELLKHPASVRGLEQALIQAMLESISMASVRSDSTAMQHHRIIIRRFSEMLRAHPLEPLHMPATSHAIGVSSRTLRMACQEQYGVSPTQYLLLRRMRLARRALRQADPDVTRVTDVATELGFWELGRFAVKYHQIFGETPSTTLKMAGLADRRDIPPTYALA